MSKIDFPCIAYLIALRIVDLPKPFLPRIPIDVNFWKMDKSIVIFLGKQIKFSIINLFNLIILSSISFLMSSFLEYDKCIFEILSINCLLFG